MQINKALPPGTVLYIDSQRYILEAITGSGGSCLFYSAKKEGSALRYGVKECCPRTLSDNLVRVNGILTGTDQETSQALAAARTQMLEEAEISQRVAAVSHRAIPVWDAPEHVIMVGVDGGLPAPAGSLLLMQHMSAAGWFCKDLLAECALPPLEGHPLRTGGLPRLSVAAQIIQETLRAVECVHEAGYIFGDIHPGNLFFADPRLEAGYIGNACLVDFGCARPLVDRYSTAPIEDRMIFTTPGYTAPEIALYNDGTLRLTKAADLYSVGRFMLYLLMGTTFYEHGRDRMLSEGMLLAQLYDDEMERLGCGRDTLRLVQHILNSSLALAPVKRYQSAAEMLVDVDELVRRTAPPSNRLALAFSTLGEGKFLGREELIGQIEQELDQGRKPVILWGFAGMGKTELAIEFARRWQINRGNAHFVRFQGSVRQTVTGPIADSFSGYDRQDAAGGEKTETQIYREVMKLLTQRGEEELLVLDNMDGGEDGFSALRGEDAFHDLCALPMRLLVTTHSRVEDGIEVAELSLLQLRQLLRQSGTRFSPHLSDEMADALICAVEGHTLTVDIIGRTLEHSIPRLSPETVLGQLREGHLDSQDFAQVSSPKDRAGRMERIQGHLSALFRLSELPKEETRMLSYALPIPPLGMPAEKFARIPDFDQETLLRLIDRGWMRRSGEDVLTLHALVRDMGWRELNIDQQALYHFVFESIRGISIGEECSRLDALRLAQYAASLSEHFEDGDTGILVSHAVCRMLLSWLPLPDVLRRWEQWTSWSKPQENMEWFHGWKSAVNYAYSYLHIAYGLERAGDLALLHKELMNWYRDLKARDRTSCTLREEAELGSWMTPDQWERHRVVWNACRQECGSLSQISALVGEDWGIACGCAQNYCEEIAADIPVTPADVICLVLAVDWSAKHGDYEIGRRRFAKVLDGLQELAEEDRKSLCRYFGSGFGRLLQHAGWEREYDAWSNAVAELERERE